MFDLSGDTPLIRTDFSDEGSWSELVGAAETPSADGFLAKLRILDERQFEGASAEQLCRAGRDAGHAVLFLADQVTMAHPDRSVLCFDPTAPKHAFRVIPGELWSVENNLSLANMDFDEFAEAAGADGIFRGF